MVFDALTFLHSLENNKKNTKKMAYLSQFVRDIVMFSTIYVLFLIFFS